MAGVLGSLAVGLVLAAIVGLILRKVIRDKKQGKSFCGGDCSACGGGCSHCSGNCPVASVDPKNVR